MVSKKNRKNLSERGDDFKRSFSGSRTHETGLYPQRIHYLLAIAILIGFTTLLYLNTFQVPWQFDDRPNIVDNLAVHFYDLSAERFFKLFSFSLSESIRLFSYFTFALNFYFGRLNVFGYHLVNLIIHLATGILLFWFVLLTLSLPSQRENYGSIGFKVAFLISLLFMVHPVQTQAVTYIVQRMTSMAAMLYLLSLILFIKARLTTGKRRIVYYGGMGLSGLLAVLSKENALMLPVFIVLYEVLFFRQWEDGFSFRPLLKIFLILGGLGLIGFVFLGGRYIDVIREGYQYRDFTMPERVLTQFRVTLHYLTLLVFPSPSRLNLDYDFPVSKSLVDPFSTFLSLVAILVFLGIGIWKMKKWPVLSFFIFWYFGNLVIESSIIPLEMVFEHRLYLPSIGPIFLFSLLLVRLWERWVTAGRLRKEAIFAGMLFLAILPLSWATIERNAVWRSEYGLWRDVVEKSPHKGRPHYNIGYFHFRSGQVAEAQKEFELALRLDPKLAPAHLNLGVIYYNQGHFDEALHLFKKALAVHPKYAQAYAYIGEIYDRNGAIDESLANFKRALKIDPYNVGALNHMGLVYIKNGDPERALIEFKKVLMINPNDVEAHVNSAEAYLRKGEGDQALLEIRKAMALNPDHGDAYTLLGMIYLHKGMLDDGVSAFRNALKINPKDVAALSNLGVAYRYKGMIDEAIFQFKKVLSLSPNDEEAHTNLGEAYLAMGNIQGAMIESEKALQINSRSVAARLNLGNAYFKQSRSDQAISEWKKALEINPKEARAHHNLAAAYYAKKEFRLALKHLDEAATLGFKVNPQLAEWLKYYR
jgi:tetratricopeptide (TPR) repeat protein